jgi:hypothetical protein
MKTKTYHQLPDALTRRIVPWSNRKGPTPRPATTGENGRPFRARLLLGLLAGRRGHQHGTRCEPWRSKGCQPLILGPTLYA